jgi:hypothetical protein
MTLPEEPKPSPSASDKAAVPAQPGSQPESDSSDSAETDASAEVGGPGGPEPTRYGDWERKGRCIDF